MLVLGSLSGVGLVVAEDMDHATDGDISNGEELKSAEDDDDQAYEINYTFRLVNNQPGNTDGTARHFAVGLTENGTLHRIKLVSQDFDFSNCEAGDARAFGIDRGNDDPGTNTDKSLLTAYKSYESTQNYIDIKFYRESQIAGEPVQGSVYDQVVSEQANCYDNPSEPGWYRINGTITGNVAGGTNTDYKIRDLSNWVYVCDCDSRAEAEETLGPPPSEDGGGDGGSGSDDSGGSDGGDGGSTATATATATDASGGDDNGGDSGDGSDGGDSGGSETPTSTATEASGGDGGDGGDGGAGSDDGGDATTTSTATEAGDGGDGTATTTTGTADTTGDATATTTAASGGPDGNGSGDSTPTSGDGPGFGPVAALVGLLAAALLARRQG